MTREEEIMQEANARYSVSHPFIDIAKESFIEGAQWADKTMIEKACRWLDCFLERTIQKPSQISLQTSEAIDIIEVRRHETIKMLLYDFRKAMEE